jgi:hypothetical protein
MVFNILSKFSVSNGNRYIRGGNDIRPHIAQIYNERTSTDLNLVTAKSTVHEPPEDGLKMDGNMYGQILSDFKCFNVNLVLFISVYNKCMSWNTKEISFSLYSYVSGVLWLYSVFLDKFRYSKFN